MKKNKKLKLDKLQEQASTKPFSIQLIGKKEEFFSSGSKLLGYFERQKPQECKEQLKLWDKFDRGETKSLGYLFVNKTMSETKLQELKTKYENAKSISSEELRSEYYNEGYNEGCDPNAENPYNPESLKERFKYKDWQRGYEHARNDLRRDS